MDKGVISIIVPIYQENNNYLKECMESICNQTYNKVEIIIVNDGMTRENYELILKYKQKYSNISIIGEKNEGVSSARNKGIDNANGEWITFVDSDDYIEKDFCKKMLSKAVEEDAQCVICGYNRLYSKKVDKIIKEADFSMDSTKFLEQVLNVQEGVGFAAMKLWNAEFIKRNKIYFKKELKVAEDALFCIEASSKIKKVYFLNESLYYYRFNEQSAVRKFNPDYANRYLLAMRMTKKSLDKNYDKMNELQLYNYIAYHLLLIIVNYCFHPQNNQRGIKLLKKICNIEEFRESIIYSNYNGLSITRKVTLFILKHRLYLLVSLIANIRQAQFKIRR